MRSFYIALLILAFSQTLSAQNGHEIKVKIDGFEEDVLYLAYNLNNKQYIADTVYRADDDSFTFKRSNEQLDPGIYMVVLPPDNSYFQLLITKEEQNFSIFTSSENLLNGATFEGKTDDNKLFFRYLRFLSAQRESAQSLNSETDEAQREAIDKAVRSYQDRLILDYPKSFTAAIIKANLPIDYSGLKETTEVAKWRFTQEHYFDNLALNDERLLRTPFLQQRIEYFVDKLHVQQPEEIIPAIDKVLGMMDPKSETFKNFVVHFLNKYARSKTIGMDAVYVHIANAYYGKGLATWTEPDQLKKILNHAARLNPLLIGKIAPDMALQAKNGGAMNLHDIESKFTVLFFWRDNCGNCKTEASAIQEFYDAFKDKGVKITAICTQKGPGVQGCWSYADENNYTEWIHLADPDRNSDELKAYDITSTPIIYLLDENKRILSKRISAKDLEKVVNFELNK